MHVEVTVDHIKNGAREKCYTCPIALAIKDALILNGLNNPKVSVDSTQYSIELMGNDYQIKEDQYKGPLLVPSERYNLPDRVSMFIRMFDAYGDGSPFSFKLGE